MSSLRLWFLLLIAVLLPLRGALAATMPCAESGTHPQAQVRQTQLHAHAAAVSNAHEPDHTFVHAHHHAGSDAAAAHDHGPSADECSLCAATCSAAALVSVGMHVPDAQPVGAQFPRLHTPPPSFISGGPERPPRAI